MSSTYDDTVLNFDLNFLNQSTNDTTLVARYEKQRKTISILKKKIIATDCLINKFYAKKQTLDETEKNLVAAKEECKQIRIDYRNALEIITKLENEYQTLLNAYKKKEEDCIHLQNQREGLQSHSNQLQLLLKEKDTIIESLRGEKKLEKASFKDFERKWVSGEKKNEILRSDISLFTNLVNELLRKKNTKQKLKPKYTELLRKYEASSNGNHSDSGENSDAEHVIFEDVEIDTQANNPNTVKKCLFASKDMGPMETDNDYSNEIVSVDTGRGSSLAYSDNEKCPQSPDYFLNDSPLNSENLVNKASVVSIATSPIMFKEMGVVNIKQPDNFYEAQNLSTITESKPKSLCTIDRCSSPIQINNSTSVSTSPIKYITKEISTSTVETFGNITSDKHIQDAQETTNSKLKSISTISRYSSPIKINNSTSVFTSPIKNVTRDIATSTVDMFENITSNKHKEDAQENTESNLISLCTTGRYSSAIKKWNSPSVPTSPVKNITRNITTNTIEVFHNITSNKLRHDLQETTESNLKSLCTGSKYSSPTTKITSVSTSPVNNTTRDVIATNTIEIFDNISCNKHRQEAQEKECLELNSSNNLQFNDHDELEMIFDTMKLNYQVVSPIPRTPFMMRGESTDIHSRLSDYIDQAINSKIHQSPYIKNMNQKIMNLIKNMNMVCNHSNLNMIIDMDSNINASMSKFGDGFPGLSLEATGINPAVVSKQLDPAPFPDDNSEFIETDTDIFQNKPDEQSLSLISSPKHRNPNFEQLPTQNQNLSEQQLITGDEIPTDKSIFSCSDNSKEINQSTTKDSKIQKVKGRKITKLEKLRKNLKPKCKIKRETPPLVKSRIKQKQFAIPKTKITETDTSLSLNDKNVYAKAVKIMAEINSQCCQSQESPVQPTRHLLSPIDTTQPKESSDSTDSCKAPSPKCSLPTSTKRKYVKQLDDCNILNKVPLELTSLNTSESTNENKINENSNEQPSKKRRRRSSNEPEIKCKRILRSSTQTSNANDESNRKSIELPNSKKTKICDTQLCPAPGEPNHEDTLQHQQLHLHDSNVISYDDLDVFSEAIRPEKEILKVKQANSNSSSCKPKDSILSCMLKKYSVNTVRPFTKKVPDTTVELICEKFEQEIAKIIAVPPQETKTEMNRFVADLQKLNYKHFIAGMMKYLTKPERKSELFGKVVSPLAPAMTKAEQILLYVVSQLQTQRPSVDIVDAVLSNIEYILFKLNRTPEFDVIESTSHFYALLCRYYGAQSRLRLFILDAMYCIHYKCIPLIKQCLDAWMHVIPLAHMRTAKNPLVICLVYLLHFYKCNDVFNKVQDMRTILSRKYFYKITDWNERKILEMFKNAIKELKDSSIEGRMLRLALILLAKRQGTQWCQNNIIKNLLQPMIEKENVPDNVKEFCVSMIGPLMKPYPLDMKVHCEIAINQLTDILNSNPSRNMEEAVITSMMFINRHNQNRINQTLLTRKMRPLSPALEEILREHIKTRPLKIWKKNLWKIALC